MEKITPKAWSWASIIEDRARQQAIRTAHMDLVQPHLAIMPDIHWGLGCCVGVALPTIGGIFPAAVGVDIGCGMIARRTTLTTADLEGRDLTSLRFAIEKAIPLSAGNYNQSVDRFTRAYVEELETLPGARNATQIAGNWHLQLKSLGSGNHFIEVTADEESRIWLFLHSGSRGVGNKLANKHINLAKKICQQYRISLPDKDLAYLAEGTAEFDEYIQDLRWAQRFAFLNRQAMMDHVTWVFQVWAERSHLPVTEEVNCHHNYTVQEEIPGTGTVWLSRKGAIDAHEGVPGLIPGSMGTASYVVTGKGNRDAHWTAPHGAGRVMSRSGARKTLTMDALVVAMEGIEWSHRDAFLDESPAAYKPVDQVIADAADLVEVRHTLHQLVNVKGD